jgi:pyruvate/2-oxoglutarate dehydrogenase complex dihydrolipoamide dehydrogenase (E3) component
VGDDRAAEIDVFDLVVIGCGPAGEKGANQVAYFGPRVPVVERHSRVGGAATAVSGVPVKTLRDTAIYLSGWMRRDTYGVGISLAPDVMMNRLRARVRQVIAELSGAVEENLNRHNIELLHGDATLSPRAVLHNDGPIDDFINTTFNFPSRADAYKYAAYDGLQRVRAHAAT